MSTEVEHTDQALGTDRHVVLGSFALVRRMPSYPAERPGYLVAEAIGQASSPYAGRAAIARCAPRVPGNTLEEPRLQELAQALTKLAHPNLIPVLEAGALPAAIFAIETRPDGEPLTARMTDAAQAPAQVARWAGDIAAALTAVHAAGLAHGRVTPAVIWIDQRDRAVLGGLVPAPQPANPDMQDPWRLPEGERDSAAGDQYQLAITVAHLLTGRQPSPPADGTHGNDLPGVAERIATVIKRGMAREPEKRFPTVAEFAGALAVAVQQTGEDLVAGVWEALSRNDRAMAILMVDLAERCVPSHADLPILRMRLTGDLRPGDLSSLVSEAPGILVTKPVVTKRFEYTFAMDPVDRTMLDSSGFADLLQSQMIHRPHTSRPNPWVPLMAGLFGGVILLAILMAAAFAYS